MFIYVAKLLAIDCTYDHFIISISLLGLCFINCRFLELHHMHSLFIAVKKVLQHHVSPYFVVAKRLFTFSRGFQFELSVLKQFLLETPSSRTPRDEDRSKLQT